MNSRVPAGSPTWAAWQPATCLPDACFCEAIADAAIRQPANTWSSLAFIVAAAWIVVRLRKADSSRKPALEPVDATLFVLSLAVIGFGSAFYHASLTFAGQVLDVSGMYFLATFMLVHRVRFRWKWQSVLTVLGFLSVNAALMIAQITSPALRRFLFALILISAIAVEWRRNRAGRRWLLVGAALQTIAFMIWLLDLRHVVCEPSSVLQGHALWHLLGAFAVVCLFRSYEEEAKAAVN